MAETDPRVKLLKLLEADQAAFAVYVEKRDALYAEMCAVLRREPGIGEKLATLKRHWCTVWQARHHEPCDFDHVKHTVILKKKLAVFSVEAICAKMNDYVATDDSYYSRARHPFNLFVKTFDSWKGIPSEPDRVDSGDKLREYRG